DLQQPAFLQREDVLGQLAGAVALVRVGGVLPLSCLHHVAGARDDALQGAVGGAANGAAAAAEAAVAPDDQLDRPGLEAGLAQGAHRSRAASLAGRARRPERGQGVAGSTGLWASAGGGAVGAALAAGGGAGAGGASPAFAGALLSAAGGAGAPGLPAGPAAVS